MSYVTKDSRITLSPTVQPVDIVTREPNRPAFLDLRQRVAQDETDGFVTVGVTSWPTLGAEVYGVAGRWWAAADASHTVDPFAELTPGTTVRAPTVARLLFDVLRF